MKADLYIQFYGREISGAETVEKFKDLWRKKGRKIKDIKTLNLYLNLDDDKVYFVVNNIETGSI